MKKISEIPRWAYTEKGMSCKKRRDIAIFIHQFTLKELIIDNIKEFEKNFKEEGNIDNIIGCGHCWACNEGYGKRCELRKVIQVLKEIFEIGDEDV